jgi:uncharacterized membrane protein
LGQIVGSAGLTVRHAFLLSNGVYTDIRPPQSDFDGVTAGGINDLGDIVGGYFLPNFVCAGYELTQGTYVKVTVPGSANSCASGINNNGEIVGEDDDGVFTQNQGQMTHHVLKVPGSVRTCGGGINAVGMVVGSYAARQGGFFANHGFLWTP